MNAPEVNFTVPFLAGLLIFGLMILMFALTVVARPRAVKLDWWLLLAVSSGMLISSFVSDQWNLATMERSIATGVCCALVFLLISAIRKRLNRNHAHKKSTESVSDSE